MELAFRGHYITEMQVWKGVFVIRCKELPTDLKEGEEIRDIDGYGGLYAITSRGRVWAYPNSTRSKGHWLKPRIDNNGYARVGLYLGNKKYKLIFIHRLVAMAYIPNPQNKPCVNHKDFNRKNNKVENLEWCTELYNVHYTRDNNLEFNSNSYKKLSPLSEEQVLLIPTLLNYGFSVKLISKLYNVGHITIRNIITKKTWRWLKLNFNK